MKVKQTKITIRELFKDYTDDGEGGVRGYGGKLDIRPPYQREFVYEDKKENLRDAVIDSIALGYPINSMHWAVRDDGTFEMIDGQQRTISICRYVEGRFTVDDLFDIKEGRKFHNLDAPEQEKILNYELTVYQCKGTKTELIKWFRTINIAGEKLTDQELLNATYHGKWVTDAKKYFSKGNCPAQRTYGRFLSGAAIRQEYLETAIRWISGGDIEGYMAEHSDDESARPLWRYVESVFDWVGATFGDFHPTMAGLQWGDLHRKYADADLNPAELQKRAAELMADDEVTKQKGIYEYLLSGEERHLSLRAFTKTQKTRAHTRQGGKCAGCDKPFSPEELQADHVQPWSKGGKTEDDNCQMLCNKCHADKTRRQMRK